MTYNLVESPYLPTYPTFYDDIVRQVRHGLSDVLDWLGEDVGPFPGEATHSYLIGDTMVVSGYMMRQIMGSFHVNWSVGW